MSAASGLTDEKKTHPHVWKCTCGMPWGDWQHEKLLRKTTSGLWRSNPAGLDPWRQWVRENIPAAADGIVYNGDDGILRHYTTDDSLGMWLLVEAKAYGATVSAGDRYTLRAVDHDGRRLHPIVVRMIDGNVPTALQHWSEPCPCCDAPSPAIPASSVVVEVHRVVRHAAGGSTYRVTPYEMPGHQLAGRLLNYLGKARQ